MRAKPIPMEEQYKLVLECRQSGLSDYHWCLEHDIKPGTFYNWVKRLRKAGTYTIPAPAGRDTYTAMPRQDIVKVELVEESVKIPRHGYPAGSDTEHIDGFPHSMELHIGSSSILVANDEYYGAAGFFRIFWYLYIRAIHKFCF